MACGFQYRYVAFQLDHSLGTRVSTACHLQRTWVKHRGVKALDANLSCITNCCSQMASTQTTSSQTCQRTRPLNPY